MQERVHIDHEHDQTKDLANIYLVPASSRSKTTQLKNNVPIHVSRKKTGTSPVTTGKKDSKWQHKSKGNKIGFLNELVMSQRKGIPAKKKVKIFNKRKHFEQESGQEYFKTFKPCSSSIDEGYKADISDSESKSIFKSIRSGKPKYILLDPRIIIDTRSVTVPLKELRDSKSRNINVRRFWNQLVADDLAKNPEKKVKYLTNKCIRYLARKLNKLFYKYTLQNQEFHVLAHMALPGIPTMESLTEVFCRYKMSGIIRLYYNDLNSRTTGDENKSLQREDIEQNAIAMCRLLEQDYKSKNTEPVYTYERVDEYTDNENI
jgi:hypothetical protein